MKYKVVNAIAAVWIIVGFGSCDKNVVTPVGKGERPLSILYNFEYTGGMWKQNGYVLLDLNHDDNKDKKFMVIDVENIATNQYKFVIKRGPLPIDSLSTNWPPNVKSVFYGYTTDMTVDAYTTLRSQSFPVNRKFNYTYDSTHKFSGTTYMVNYLWNPHYAGNMVGKTPQGRAGFWEGDSEGNAQVRDIIFYFKEGYFTDVTSIGNGAMPLTTLVDGIPTVTDDWKKVDAVLNVDGYYASRLFFDFDEWRFFATTDFCPSIYGAPCPGGLQYADYQSMDNLMDWPEGWRKP